MDSGSINAGSIPARDANEKASWMLFLAGKNYSAAAFALLFLPAGILLRIAIQGGTECYLRRYCVENSRG